MKVDYKIPLQVVLNSLQHDRQIEVQVEEVHGIDFFPDNDIDVTGETDICKLHFNPKVQTLLALYNMVMVHGCDTSEAIMHYVLFHACMETDNYTLARTHLDAFRKEISRFRQPVLSEGQYEEAGAQLLMQLYFLLYHEAFHIFFYHRPDQRASAINTTRSLLLGIMAKWEDDFSLVSETELLAHPKIRQHIENMIPRELPAHERQAMKEKLLSLLSANRLRPEYISEVLDSDPMLMEEITCDRQAWLHLLSIFENHGVTAQDILQIHLYLFAVFNAMDFNKVLLNQFVPSYHGRSHYNGMRVVLRHKAFKELLRQYRPEAYELLKSEYLDLNVGLESVCCSLVMALHRYADDLTQLYSGYQTGTAQPDFAQYNRLNEEMAAITRALY